MQVTALWPFVGCEKRAGPEPKLSDAALSMMHQKGIIPVPHLLMIVRRA